MPCTEAPGPTLTGYENTKITYAAGVVGEEHECDKEAEYEFEVTTHHRVGKVVRW